MAKTGISLAALLCVGASAASADDRAGVYARVDALLLGANLGGGSFEQVFVGVPSGTNFGGALGDELAGGVRFVLGAEDCSGLGVRFQYFDWENDVDYNGQWEGASDFLFSGDMEIDVYAFDAEVTQRGSFHRWDLLVGGGLRAGGLSIFQPGNLFDGPGTFYGVRSGGEFDGVGPTVSLAADRRLGASGLSVVGRARASLLFGEQEQIETFGADLAADRFTIDDHVQVIEMQFGLNYRQSLGPADGTFGVFWEAQRWDTNTGDLGLHGLSLQTGLLY
ncbi:hypothetical protein [Botrimarina sp.]|uniref:hypothetical protein n=1 Tax=Botrimarina sp. TaxID=2795802 RepID=UPI0032EFA767